MISRKHRFRGRNSLNPVYKNGQSARIDMLTIKAVKSRGEDYRLSVVVSKKVSKSAVKRNRIRRRIYEQFRLIRKQKNIPIKLDFIVTVFDEKAAILPVEKLAKICSDLLKKVEQRLQ